MALQLKTPWADGTDWITMTPSTFLERLCTLVPRPGKNSILYTGVLAGHAKHRQDVVPGERDDRRPRKSDCELCKYGIGVDVLAACPCGGG